MLWMVWCGALIAASGCATPQKSDLASFQGTWKGRIMQGNPAMECSFVISGKTFDFRASDTNIWYKGTFSLREDTTPKQYIAVIGECAFPQYVGKTSLAIYQMKDGTLTITGNEPGNPAAPAAFDTPDAARMELRKP